nr:hypothetical protein [Apis mellifera nudivirus]
MTDHNELKKVRDSEDEEGEDSLSEDNHFYVAFERFTLPISEDSVSTNYDDDDDNDNDNDNDTDTDTDKNCDDEDNVNRCTTSHDPMNEHSYCMVRQPKSEAEEEEEQQASSLLPSSTTAVTNMEAPTVEVAAAAAAAAEAEVTTKGVSSLANDENSVSSTTPRSPPYDPTACPSLSNIKIERHLKKKKERVKRQNTRLRSKSPIPRKAITLTVPTSSSAAISSPSNRILTIKNGQDLVRISCNNRSNFDNIELMEWSEAVLLQLCYINEPLDFKLIDWKAVKQIFLYQWRYEVTLPLQEYVGRKETLSNIIIRNHARKVQLGLIPYSEMFTPNIKNRLNINYRLLCEYAAENRRRERICIPNMKLKWH